LLKAKIKLTQSYYQVSIVTVEKTCLDVDHPDSLNHGKEQIFVEPLLKMEYQGFKSNDKIVKEFSRMLNNIRRGLNQLNIIKEDTSAEDIRVLIKRDKMKQKK